MTEAESKIIIDHIHRKMGEYEWVWCRDLNFSYRFDHDSKTVDIVWWDGGREEKIRTETYRLDLKLIKGADSDQTTSERKTS